MKTELRPVPHTTLPGQTVLEIWHDGQFIGQVVGAEGPGVRIITKHAVEVHELTQVRVGDLVLSTVEVRIEMQ